jgi:hypothetical protein
MVSETTTIPLPPGFPLCPGFHGFRFSISVPLFLECSEKECNPRSFEETAPAYSREFEGPLLRGHRRDETTTRILEELKQRLAC